MKKLAPFLVLLLAAACRPAALTPGDAFKKHCSPAIQQETQDLVRATHNKAYPRCQADPGALRLVGFRTVLAKDDSERYVTTAIVRWEVLGCDKPIFYETRQQRISKGRPMDPKNYGISIEPVYP